jgi:hypothetical protein
MKTGTLYEVVLRTMEKHDGLCMDNEEERVRLAQAICVAWNGAVRRGLAKARRRSAFHTTKGKEDP